MHEISDEMIMAWVDGEADPADRALVEAYLKRDPAAAAERFARFTRTGRELGQLFGQPIHEPVPDRLIEAVLGAPVKPRTSRLLAMFDGLRNRTAPLMGAAAFATVLIVGGALWTTYNPPHDKAGTALIADAGLQQVLETARSGTQVPLGTGDARVRVTMVATFANLAGQFCREYDQVYSAQKVIVGVACRRDDGTWQIEVQATTVAAAKSTGHAPAGREAVPAIDAVVERLINGIALDPQPEADLIARKWGRKQ